MSLAGTLSRCVRRRCAAAFRCGVVAALAVPPAVLPDIGAEHAAALVTMALSVSACSLCPLLVLAIWWRGLTAAGAAAGLLTGAGLPVAAAGLSTGPGTGGAGAVLAQPTLIAAPAVFAVMAGGVAADPPPRPPPRRPGAGEHAPPREPRRAAPFRRNERPRLRVALTGTGVRERVNLRRPLIARRGPFPTAARPGEPTAHRANTLRTSSTTYRSPRVAFRGCRSVASHP